MASRRSPDSPYGRGNREEQNGNQAYAPKGLPGPQGGSRGPGQARGSREGTSDTPASPRPHRVVRSWPAGLGRYPLDDGGRRAIRNVVFVFDFGATHRNAPQSPPLGVSRGYDLAERCHEPSSGSFRRNARWLARAFAQLVRMPRGHCAPLQFRTGGARTRPARNAKALTKRYG